MISKNKWKSTKFFIYMWKTQNHSKNQLKFSYVFLFAEKKYTYMKHKMKQSFFVCEYEWRLYHAWGNGLMDFVLIFFVGVALLIGLEIFLEGFQDSMESCWCLMQICLWATSINK
jgi:hypothetical protein